MENPLHQPYISWTQMQPLQTMHGFQPGKRINIKMNRQKRKRFPSLVFSCKSLKEVLKKKKPFGKKTVGAL